MPVRDYVRGTFIPETIWQCCGIICTLWLRIMGRGLPKLQKQTLL